MLELVNTATLLPHPPNWTKGVHWSRAWKSTIASGVTGAEDRAALRTLPLTSLEYTLRRELDEREALTQRLQAARKSGRAAIPRWDRPQYLAAEAGGSRAFTVADRWPWAAGDFALFLHPRSSMVNKYLGINCGGDATGDWIADAGFDVGEAITTAEAIDTSGVDYPAPQAVYQSLRQFNGPDPLSRLTYTLEGFEPGVPCHVRLHFAEIVPEETYRTRQMNLEVTGDTQLTTAAYEPIQMAPGYFKACQQIYRLYPDGNGRLVIAFEAIVGYQINPPDPEFAYVSGVNGIEVYQLCYEARELAPGSGPGQLVWATRLLGQYPAGQAVYPLLFGTPSVADATHLTDHHADLTLKVTEPLGLGDVATPGACPVELDTRPPVWTGGGGPEWVDGPTPHGTLDTFASRYAWANDGTEGDLPNAAQIAWNIAILYEELALHSEVVGPRGRLYWQLTLTGLAPNQFSAANKFPNFGILENDPTFNVQNHIRLAFDFDSSDTSGGTDADGLTPSYRYCQT